MRSSYSLLLGLSPSVFNLRRSIVEEKKDLSKKWKDKGAVTMKMAVFWDVAPCRLVEAY
jgi:hypothetical protein